ncbi:MAG: type IV pilus secretin PilQ, partial [Gammaproteobacteria bacterium]|nr:type IV pilus secretin PilQ [Gammaproteobacteria bacterium]
LLQSVPYELDVQGQSLLVTIGGGPSSIVSQGVTPTITPATPAREVPMIEDIDFRRGESGEGRVIITLSDPSAAINLGEEAGRILVDFIAVGLPA